MGDELLGERHHELTMLISVARGGRLGQILSIAHDQPCETKAVRLAQRDDQVLGNPLKNRFQRAGFGQYTP